MDALVAVIAVVIVGITGLSYLAHRRAVAAKALTDSRSRARRWVERLGGQVYSLEPKDDPAARQALADAVAEDRSVTVEGHEYLASPTASDRTRHYHPGGAVASRPVPRGWYSDPWWQSAFDTGSWAVSSYLIASSLVYGTAGCGWDSNYAAGDQAAEANADDSGHEGGAADYAFAATGESEGAGDY